MVRTFFISLSAAKAAQSVPSKAHEPKKRRRDLTNRKTHRIFFSRKSLLCRIARFAVAFVKREDGPTAVEYAVMLALIIVVCISALSVLGSNASNTFSFVGSEIGTAS